MDPATVLEAQCRQVLDACIARVESPLFAHMSGGGVDAQIAGVIDAMINAVRFRRSCTVHDSVCLIRTGLPNSLSHRCSRT